ncbi:hypothetical protein QBC34DRAFT_143845 [Podospora aff. communis PSN243]|uniref:F-box domain-containing protein n=1 Tax=Podospora aff. communis PSN243 TaxID=3040156 RepID=A0AAV9GHS5_9PEZI|nr:hypothetical protein QBC34DRAFT_143845 [Podospora aff. communis PSN243]
MDRTAPRNLQGPNLGSLPVEILLEICAQLCTECQIAGVEIGGPLATAGERQEIRHRGSALASLARASKTLHDIATPHLYHFLCHQPQDQAQRLPPLIRTLVLRPDLANHVRRIEVDHSNSPYPLSDEFVDLFAGAAAQQNMNLLPGWSGKADRAALVLLELLLVHATNIRALHLFIGKRTTLSDLLLISDSQANTRHLSAPTSLTACARPHPNDAQPYFNLRPILLLIHYIPRLNSLYLHRGTATYTTLAEAFTRKSSGLAFLTSLAFDECSVRPIYVAFFIRAINRLEVLKCTFHGLCFESTDPDLDPSVIVEYLRLHKTTLREFTLFSDPGRVMRPRRDLKSLKDFSKLETVVTELEMLRGSNREEDEASISLPEWLPQSLKRLELVHMGWTQRELQQLWDLHAAVLRGEFKELRELVVEGSSDAKMTGAEQVALGVAWQEIEGFRYSLRETTRETRREGNEWDD